MTQEEAILMFAKQVDSYIPSYDLEKVTLCGQWIGTRGSRTARHLAETGQINREKGSDLLARGVFYDYKGKPIENKYVYFKHKTVGQLSLI